MKCGASGGFPKRCFDETIPSKDKLRFPIEASYCSGFHDQPYVGDIYTAFVSVFENHFKNVLRKNVLSELTKAKKHFYKYWIKKETMRIY